MKLYRKGSMCLMQKHRRGDTCLLIGQQSQVKNSAIDRIILPVANVATTASEIYLSMTERGN
jgi:hypothetical protein